MARPRPPGHIEQRSPGSWRVRFCVARRRYRFTVRASTLEDVEQFAFEKYAELRDAARRQKETTDLGHALPQAVRLSGLLDKFEADVLPNANPGTARSYRDSLKSVRQYLAATSDPALRDLSKVWGYAFLAWRRSHRATARGPSTRGPLTGRTLNKDRAFLHALFAWAIDRLGWLDINPMAKVAKEDEDKRDPVILTPAEYDAMLDACPDAMVRSFALVMGEAGLRNAEVANLRWEHLEFGPGFLFIEHSRRRARTKTKRSRRVPMTRRLVEPLRAHAAEFRLATGSPWVFPAPRRRADMTWRTASAPSARSQRQSRRPPAVLAAVGIAVRDYGLQL